MVERIFQRLDQDMSCSLDYEASAPTCAYCRPATLSIVACVQEFQLGLLEDEVVANIFAKCMSGDMSDREISDLISDVSANKPKKTAVPMRP